VVDTPSKDPSIHTCASAAQGELIDYSADICNVSSRVCHCVECQDSNRLDPSHSKQNSRYCIPLTKMIHPFREDTHPRHPQS
jgi:hypothetical protein